MSAHDAILVDDELPARPRRRLVTPPVIGISAVLLAALGFFAGVEVQKGQAGPSSAAAGAPAAGGAAGTAGRPGGIGGPGGGFANAPGDVTFGTVSSKDGHYLYVKDSNGTTIKVRVSSNSTINRTAKAKAAEIHPGDTVVVQGSQSKNGTVSATRVTATAAGASGGRGFGGPPGGFQPQSTG
jgi:Domain of unknown function (DUF5666)